MQDAYLNELYYKWICSMVIPDNSLRNMYSNVLRLLHDTEFYYLLPLDENRMKDGIDLRYHFSCACKIPYDIIKDNTLVQWCNTCSVLEMMASLAKRCEDDIMSDNHYGDRTSEWFSIMFRNLGLDKFDDSKWTNDGYAETNVKIIIDKFLSRNYNPDGSNGNIFVLEGPYYDVRTMQIWDQMCLFMSRILGY